jgi:class 3 adenylate cyclase
MIIKSLRFLLAIILFLISLLAFPQDQKFVDSLKLELKKTKTDSTRVNILNLIAFQYLGNSPDDANNYLKQALLLATDAGYKKGIAVSFYNSGLNFFKQSKYIDALKSLEKSAKVFNEIGNLRGLAAAYNNIGSVYYEINDYSKALQFQLKAIAIQRKINAKKSISISLNNIGNIYIDLKDYEKARIYYDSAMVIQLELNDSTNLALCYNNLGIIYNNTNNQAKALEYYLKSVSIKEKLGSKKGLAITLNNIGNLYLNQKSVAQALNYFNQSLDLAKESQSLDDEKNACKGLADAYDELGKIPDAYKYYKLYAELKDSLFNTENQKQVLEIQHKYESEKKENLITLQQSELEKQDIRIEKQHTEVYALAAGAILLILSLIILFLGYKNKKKDNVALAIEQKRSEDLLLNILPAEIAMELKKYGKSHAKKYEMVTVLFADFKNFTLFAEKLKPEEVLDELDFCFREFDAILAKYKIEKIKTIGDSYMCAGGIPVPDKTNPLTMANCGLDMRDFMEHYKKTKIKAGEIFLDVRIGIHTGPLVAGVVGAKKFAYDIWGDTVNIASRMESSGQIGKVNISGETFKYVKECFACESRGKIVAKNKGEIDMYFIERL